MTRFVYPLVFVGNSHSFSMSSIARSLAEALPEPKDIGEKEEQRSHSQIKVLGAGALDETQVTFKVLRTEHTALLIILIGYLVLV